MQIVESELLFVSFAKMLHIFFATKSYFELRPPFNFVTAKIIRSKIMWAKGFLCDSRDDICSWQSFATGKKQMFNMSSNIGITWI